MKSLINIYISTHKPVSSVQLVPFISLSSSTIRKELQKLEFYGYIIKSNVSSGRIPSNRGIKFYLNKLIDGFDNKKKSFDLPKIDDFDFNSISDSFLTLLSTKTQNIGFLFLNSIFDLNLNKIKLFKIGSYRIMTIIQSPNKWTFSKIFRTNKNYPEVDLKKWENILNREFKGKTLRNTFKIIRNRLFKEKVKYINIYRELYSVLKNKNLMGTDLYYKGTLNILNSDLVNPVKVKRILETLEDKVKLSSFLNDIFFDSIKKPNIVFGTETGISELEDFILIFSNFYYSKNPIGNIGVIGPKFMSYPNTIYQIEHYSSYFSKNLSKNIIGA